MDYENVRNPIARRTVNSILEPRLPYFFPRKIIGYDEENNPVSFGILAILPREHGKIIPILNANEEFRQKVINALEQGLKALPPLEHEHAVMVKFSQSNTSFETLGFRNAYASVERGPDYGYHGHNILGIETLTVLFECVSLYVPMLYEHMEELVVSCQGNLGSLLQPPEFAQQSTILQFQHRQNQ